MKNINSYDELALRTFFANFFNLPIPFFLKSIGTDVFKNSNFEPLTNDLGFFFEGSIGKKCLYVKSFEKSDSNYFIEISGNNMAMLSGYCGDATIEFSFDGQNVEVINTDVGPMVMS